MKFAAHNLAVALVTAALGMAPPSSAAGPPSTFGEEKTSTSSKRFFQSIPKVQDSAGRRKTSGNSHDDTRSTK
jgi:hypothetical protein